MAKQRQFNIISHHPVHYSPSLWLCYLDPRLNPFCMNTATLGATHSQRSMACSLYCASVPLGGSRAPALACEGCTVPSIRLRGQNLRGGFPYSLEPDIQALPLPFTCFLSINFSFSIAFFAPACTLSFLLFLSLSLLSPCLGGWQTDGLILSAKHLQLWGPNHSP